MSEGEGHTIKHKHVLEQVEYHHTRWSWVQPALDWSYAVPKNGEEGMFVLILAYGVIIGMSTALLWHFSNIWIHGQHLVGEPNIMVRSLETVMLMAILVFGISRFIDCLRNKG